MSVEISETDSEPPSNTPPIKVADQQREFYRKHFPQSSSEDWSDWGWQVRNRITTLEKLKEVVDLSENDFKVLTSFRENLPLAITPYYASLINPHDFCDPIRKCSVPSYDELLHSPEENEDPLGENHQNPVSCIVHRYPDRVLFLSTSFCSMNCRFCTRARIVGEHQCFSSGYGDYDKAFAYIRNHPEIRDVLISGGDPFTLTDYRLEYLLKNIRKIPHVEMIRIGTKIPAVMPQRVTPELCQMLKKYHPLFISLHFTHPVELTGETRRACEMLADAGIPLGSQTVLLKGVNDNVETMRKLFTGLLKSRVRPYYMYQCDLIVGSKHFRTPIKTGLDIIQGLRGYSSGYAVPQFIIDAPGGGGKIPLLPEYVVGYDENHNLIMNNYQGQKCSYPDF